MHQVDGCMWTSLVVEVAKRHDTKYSNTISTVKLHKGVLVHGRDEDKMDRYMQCDKILIVTESHVDTFCM